MTVDVQELIGMWNPANADPLTPVSADDDAVLVKAARCDSAAFAALYRRYVTPIYRYAYSGVGSDAEAQDLTAQVFLETLESLPRYRDRGNFAAWLFTIARRRAIDHYRRRPSLPLDDAPDPIKDDDPLSRLIHYEALQYLQVLVAHLDDDQRE